MLETRFPHTVLIPEDTLQRRVAELGEAISRDYAGQDLVVVGVLRGVVFFVADLLRAITVPVAVDFMAVSSYGPSTTTSGAVRILKDLDQSIEGRHVLLVEDIISTGLTLRYILRNLRRRLPASLRVCVLLDKPAHRLAGTELDYVGFEVPNRFVVGYGLDLDQRYRNLPYIAVPRGE